MLRQRCFILFAVLCAASCVRTFGADHPNVVVVLTDDQGWGDLSLNGNRNLSTPNIDSLARDGAQFDRFYVCPVCSPTRSEFLTGRYHPRSGVYSTSAGGERMDLDESTIAETFQAAGYATAAFGKWHNGMQYPYHPNGRGFDEYYGFCSGHWGNYFDPMLEHNGKVVRGKGFVIDDFTEQAMSFMEENRENPFFIYLPYNTPHSPMQVPDEYWNRFKDKTLEMHNRDPKKENLPHVRCALAMCENIDWNVGRLLKKLEDLRIADNTIVIYFCDNGPNGTRWNGGMKGRKGSTDEGGVRSPLLVRWPDQIPAGRTVDRIAAAIDLRPTLADLCGIPVSATKPLDGVSLKPLLTRDDSEWSDRLLYSFWKGKTSVRSQTHRLGYQGGLFDIAADPGQRTDIGWKHPQMMHRLQTAASEFKKTVVAELGTDTRPFVIGHPDYEWTQLPARDFVATGAIKRSNRFPNCSYFGNWVNLDDTISLDVDVLAAGEFEVDLYYTAVDAGAKFELAVDDSKLAGQISEAHNPPETGAEQDRVERAESYVKDFRPLSLGTIRLEKGPANLTLRAIEKPGREVMEFRMLMLKRIR